MAAGHRWQKPENVSGKYLYKLECVCVCVCVCVHARAHVLTHVCECVCVYSSLLLALKLNAQQPLLGWVPFKLQLAPVKMTLAPISYVWLSIIKNFPTADDFYFYEYLKIHVSHKSSDLLLSFQWKFFHKEMSSLLYNYTLWGAIYSTVKIRQRSIPFDFQKNC